MNKLIYLMLLACASANLAASPITVGFDDLTNYQSVSNGYNGLNWTNTLVINQNDYPGSGYDNVTQSPNNAGWTYFSDISVTKNGGGTFNFDSGYFASAWDSTGQLTLTTYLNNVVQHTLDVQVHNTIASYINVNWTNIDRLVVTRTIGGSQFAFDDLVFDLNPTIGSVPEPATIALMGLGFAGMGYMRRRKTQA